ncbi:MAG TPA: GNAT family N-acetyltransferase [Candidatus Limnocylindria bacterium]|nr:GNAT family N-acetyltransferase [Candidatus Limnocylindria bacterium]
MNEPKGYRIDRFDPMQVSPAELREAAELYQAQQSERTPEDPLMPVEAIEKRLRAVVPGRWQAYFRARAAGGALVGYGVIGRSLNEPENAHLRWTELVVSAQHRRKGVGRALLRRLVDAVADQGDDVVLVTQTTDRIPSGSEFARAIGAEPGLDMKTNQLDISKVDRAKILEWAAIAPEGYRLEWIDHAVPADLVAPYIQASNAMNDAPRGGLRMADWKLTEEQIRERESWFRQAGVEWWLLVAIHEATGEGAGFTEVTYDPKISHVIWQQGTGVTLAHRGHRLGMWMKAVMLRRILDERPKALFIRTGNANTNAQMLAINTQLGFVLAWSSCLWQITITDARRAVGRERAGATA